MTRSIYRTPAGREHTQRLYLHALERLSVPAPRRAIETEHGATHVLGIGPEDAPPVVIFQGATSSTRSRSRGSCPWRGVTACTLRTRWGIPGSAPKRGCRPATSPTGDGRRRCSREWGWIASPWWVPPFGAGIALRLAAVAPERVLAAALLVPSGRVSPPVLRLAGRIVAPMLSYMLRPSAERLYRAARPMFTSEPDPHWLDATRASFDHVRLETGMPRPATAAELAGFTAPTLVVAAERDPFFPGPAVAARAREVLPEARVELLDAAYGNGR